MYCNLIYSSYVMFILVLSHDKDHNQKHHNRSEYQISLAKTAEMLKIYSLSISR